MRLQQLLLRPALAMLAAAALFQPAPARAASHREAPITALDQKADITDWYTFVSPEHPDRVVMILNVDPFLEPSNGPNYFPFDPGILYEFKVDNNNDAKEDIIFQVRFKTEIRAPGVFTGFVGNLAGIPAITALDGPGSEGLSLRQTYTVTMMKRGKGYRSRIDLGLENAFRRADQCGSAHHAELRGRCGNREPTRSPRESGCSRARWRIRSISTWARPSTR